MGYYEEIANCANYGTEISESTAKTLWIELRGVGLNHLPDSALNYNETKAASKNARKLFELEANESILGDRNVDMLQKKLIACTKQHGIPYTSINTNHYQKNTENFNHNSNRVHHADKPDWGWRLMWALIAFGMLHDSCSENANSTERNHAQALQDKTAIVMDASKLPSAEL